MNGKACKRTLSPVAKVIFIFIIAVVVKPSLKGGGPWMGGETRIYALMRALVNGTMFHYSFQTLGSADRKTTRILLAFLFLFIKCFIIQRKVEFKRARSTFF